MKPNFTLRIITLLSAAVPVVALAGPLTPPAPPAPTMKTMDEVEARIPIHAADLPTTITESGSYYLTENINLAIPNQTGIRVTAEDVVIDLNGFTLSGPGGNAVGFGSGILASAASSEARITIRNGTVCNWAFNGITLNRAALIENINARDNGDDGIFLNKGATVRNCEFSNNFRGLRHSSSDGLIIEGCTARENTVGMVAIDGQIRNNLCVDNQIGIMITGATTVGYAVVTGNTCNDNAEEGIRISGDNCLVKNNASTSNQIGIDAENAENCVIMGNVCNNNTDYGIRSDNSGSSNRIEANTVCENNTGISLGGDSIAVKNMLHGNTTSIMTDGGVRGPTINMTAGGTIGSEHPWANFIY